MCDKIDLGYKTIHNDVMRIYNDDSHLYYVGSWLHNRTFTKFCGSLRKLVGCFVDTDVCEDVLDVNNTVEACIKKYCSSLSYNEKFRAYLQSLDLSINVELEEEEPTTVDTDYYSDTTDETETSTTEVESIDTTAADAQVDNVEATGEHDTPMVHVREHERNYPGNGGENTPVGDTYAPITDVTTLSAEHNVGEETTTPATTPAHTTTQQSTSQPQSQPTATSSTQSSKPEPVEDDDLEQYDTYEQVDEDEYVGEKECKDRTDEEEVKPTTSQSSHTTPSSSHTYSQDYDPDRNGYMGSVDMDTDYQPMDDRPYKPRTRKHPKNYTSEEVERLRSHGTPLELESLPPTKEEIDLLAQCNIKPEQIADTNYLAQLRLYLNLTREQHEEPEETMEEFVRNADDVAVHKLKSNSNGSRYIHTCSAARGVMYASPSLWNKMVDDKWKICVYLDGQGKNFHYIENAEEFLKLVEKDDVVIKITGMEKVEVVKALYSGLLENVRGTAYTLIRVAARTNMDAAFAHYVGAMAETEDSNDDLNDY